MTLLQQEQLVRGPITPTRRRLYAWTFLLRGSRVILHYGVDERFVFYKGQEGYTVLLFWTMEGDMLSTLRDGVAHLRLHFQQAVMVSHPGRMSPPWVDFDPPTDEIEELDELGFRCETFASDQTVAGADYCAVRFCSSFLEHRRDYGGL